MILVSRILGAVDRARASRAAGEARRRKREALKFLRFANLGRPQHKKLCVNARKIRRAALRRPGARAHRADADRCLPKELYEEIVRDRNRAAAARREGE